MQSKLRAKKGDGEKRLRRAGRKVGKDWKKGKLQEDQKWVRGKVGEHGCNNIRAVNIHLVDDFFVTKVRETLSDSHQLKEKFSPVVKC